MSAERILIVEDDRAIAVFVQTMLEREGFITEIVPAGNLLLARVEAFGPDLILLDLMLPGMDGLQLCQAIRQRPDYTPIIMLTAKDDDVDKVVGLEIGADDYITKPFKTRELVARIRAVLRLAKRSGASLNRQLVFNGLEIDLDGHQVRLDGQEVSLSPKEFELLALLAANPGRVFGREMLLEHIWGYDFAGETRTVDVHIQRLRSHLEPDPHAPRYLVTVRNFGYKFERNQ